MKFGSWNVRAILDSDQSKIPERRTAIVANELSRYKSDIASLSETGFSDENQSMDKSTSHILYWKRKSAGEKH